jgi:hypothetical protein
MDLFWSFEEDVIFTCHLITADCEFQDGFVSQFYPFQCGGVEGAETQKEKAMSQPPQSKMPAFIPLRRGKQAAWLEYDLMAVIWPFYQSYG